MSLNEKVRCSGCGYDLAGLSGAGRCPECGNEYDTDSHLGVTRRSAVMEAHARGDRVVYLFKLWGLAGLAAACFGLGFYASLGKANPQGPILIGGMFGAVFGFGAFVVWMTDKPEA